MSASPDIPYGVMPAGKTVCSRLDWRKAPREITDWDRQTFAAITALDLTFDQADHLVRPEATFPTQPEVLAVHWHPEQVALDLIRARISAMFPGRADELVIPTQHNQLLTMGGFAGVEVDCYSCGFNRKVQLLLHMRADRAARASALKAMLRHTFKYRSSQLLDYLNCLCSASCAPRRERAAARAGTDREVADFAAAQATKLKTMVEEAEGRVPEEAFKNKLVRDYIDAMRQFHDAHFINKAQVYVQAVKEEVKTHFPLDYFYRTSEVIEEARSVGAGVVIPHPEQFWPILLADYDVDGIEVWNPQSQRYTQFLITAVNRQNGRWTHADRPLLILMGDDCHMSEKLKDPASRDPEKAGREVGLQPAWDHPAIAQSLAAAGVTRKSALVEYRARLS